MIPYPPNSESHVGDASRWALKRSLDAGAWEQIAIMSSGAKQRERSLRRPMNIPKRGMKETPKELMEKVRGAIHNLTAQTLVVDRGFVSH